MNETITLDVELRAFVRRDAETRWIAICPSIGVASQGTDADDAKRCLDEAVQFWFESCIERGTLERALQESAVACAAQLPMQRVAGVEAHRIRVSLPTM